MIEQAKTPDAAEPATRAVEDLFDGTPPGIIKSMKAYMRELPALLANPKHDGWWVCYHGDERIGIAYKGRELLRKCVERGFQEDEIYIGIIQKQDPDEWAGLDLH
jgi:hypothetical protein